MAAERLNHRVLFALDHLLDFPHSGRPIPEYPDVPHREVLVNPFRFFYKVDGDTIEVFDVYHQAQLPET